MNENYGKSSDNPIQLNSVVASRLFLNNLVNAIGYHILYHRWGSFHLRSDGPIIDQYEVMCSDNHYEDFYINIYNESNQWIPPKGYLFEYELVDVDLFLSDYELNELGQIEINIAERDIFKHEWVDDPEMAMFLNVNLPLLELYMDKSHGVNGFNENFPFAQIRELMKNHRMFTPDRLGKVISSIKPREKQNFEAE